MSVPANLYNKSKKHYRKPTKKSVTAIVKNQIAKSQEWGHFTRSMVDEFGSVPNSWLEYDLCSQITEGDDVMNRQGREIRIGSLEIKGIMSAAAVGGVGDDLVNQMRLCIALWNGSATTPLETSGVDLETPIMKSDLAGNQLIKKYVDKFIPLNTTCQGRANGYVPEYKTFKYYKKFKEPIVVKFSSNAGTYPDKKLMVSFISDSSAVTNPGFVSGYMNLRFTQ